MRQSVEVSIMKTAVMVVDKRQGPWAHLPIGAALPQNGSWRGQPALFKPKEPAFARNGEPPPKAMKEAPKGKYEAGPGRVMF